MGIPKLPEWAIELFALLAEQYEHEHGVEWRPCADDFIRLFRSIAKPILYPQKEGEWCAWLMDDNSIDIGKKHTETITLRSSEDCNNLSKLLSKVKKYFEVSKE